MADAYNTVIDQGATWQLVVEYLDSNNNPVNITNYSAALQLRTSPLAKTAALTLTTQNGGLTIQGNLGKVSITATATQTTALAPQRYVYDLEITSPSQVVTRLLEGTIQVSPQVTRT